MVKKVGKGAGERNQVTQVPLFPFLTFLEELNYRDSTAQDAIEQGKAEQSRAKKETFPFKNLQWVG